MTKILNQSFAIANPYVKFAMCKEAFDNFACSYNADKELSEQIRSPHYELFYKVVRFYISKLSQDKVLFKGSKFLSFNSDTIPILRTNNYKLSKELKRDKATIYRQLMRLIKSGAISDKINHGTKHDYELLINPQLLLILDMDNPKYIRNSDFLPKNEVAENQSVSDFEIANCNQYQNKQETFNNKIILLKGIPNTRDELKETKKETKKETEKITRSTEASKIPCDAERKYSARLRAEDARFADLKNRYAQWLFTIALNSIWKNHTIFDGEKERALRYILSNYFEHCRNEATLFSCFSEFKWRVEAAGRYINRKVNFEMHIFPTSYFDLNNNNGFKGTKKWYRDYVFRLENNIRQRKTLSDDLKLANILRKYTKTPNYITFQLCQAYIQDNIPHKLTQFLQTITPITS